MISLHHSTLVLFVALAAGHYRLAIPDGVGQLGLALFVYCVGLITFKAPSLKMTFLLAYIKQPLTQEHQNVFAGITIQAC